MLVKYRKARPTYFNRLFDDAFTKDFFTNYPTLGTQTKVNISETETHFHVYLQVPGFAKEDIDVHIDGDLLKITGSKEAKDEDNKESFVRKEFSATTFSKSFTLPENVNTDEISANYGSGILTLSLQKTITQAQLKRTIEVK